jgi:hypothetical protein
MDSRFRGNDKPSIPTQVRHSGQANVSEREPESMPLLRAALAGMRIMFVQQTSNS